jgi:hypothetical protein
MSPDIPLGCCTQFACGAADSAEIFGLQLALRVATSLTAPHPDSSCAVRLGRRMVLSRQTFENYTVVASALVAEILEDAPGSNPGTRFGRAGSTPAERTSWVSSVRDGTGKTCRIQTPVPMTGRAGSTPAGRTALRVVGEIAYHSWLLPLNSGFDSRAAHLHHPRR